jgi:5-formyltetrahydrofolate cyclo-ligase
VSVGLRYRALFCYLVILKVKEGRSGDRFLFTKDLKADMAQGLSCTSDNKSSLRKELLLKRRALESGAWLEKSGAVASFLRCMDAFRDARKVHCYVSMDAEREVCTSGILEWLDSERKEIYMPYIEAGRMVTVQYMPGQSFSPSKVGPPVPDPLVFSEEERFDIVIVPLVGVDRNGARLGFGMGWYDRFFDHLTSRGIFPLRIGLAFEFQFVPVVPSDPWDQLLDVVVTENEIVNCMRSRA